MHSEPTKLALAIIVIRSRRPWETTTITLHRLIALIEEAEEATGILESAISLGSRILLNAVSSRHSEFPTNLSIEVLKRLSPDVTSIGIMRALPLISGLNDNQICKLLAYANAIPAEDSLNDIMIAALDGQGCDIAVRVSALLNCAQNHVPSSELLAKLTETINCNDLPRALAGVSLAKKLLLSAEEFSSFLETLWPQRIAWF